MFGCDVGMPGSLYVRILDEQGKPVPSATVTFRYSTGGDISGMKPTQQHTVTETTDITGAVVYSVVVRRYTGVGVQAAGFYSTQLYGDAWSQFAHNIGTSGTPVQIVLKRVHQPTSMLGKRAFIRIDIHEGDFWYDLVAGDLMPPLGHGQHGDLHFIWTRPDRNDATERRARFNVEVPGNGNGIIAFLRAGGDLASQSELVSDYHAPKDGYFQSTRLAHDNLLSSSSDIRADNSVKGAFNDELCYYLRIRSEDRPLYGKIYGTITFIDRPTVSEFEFLYYINPTGDMNIECDMKTSHISGRRGELEYPVGAP